MDLVGLDVIGWVYTIVSGLALAFGVAVIGLYYASSGARAYAGRRLLEDIALFFIWLVGLAGGIGVLHGMAWSRWLLEYFCWTLMVLLVMSSWSRLQALPRPRNMRGIQLALFVMPVLAFCFATILTLRGESAVRVLSN